MHLNQISAKIINGKKAMSPEQFDNLMQAASRGDKKAFGQLANTAQDNLYRFALSAGLPGHLAAEAVQETLLRAYRLRKKWQQDSRAMTWLCGIALNVTREYRRKCNRAETGVEVGALIGLAGSTNEVNQAEHAENLAALARALEQLPDRQREALSCRYLRQMDVKTTAEIMACAEGTVKATTAAALSNLRTIMNIKIRNHTDHSNYF